MKPIQKGLDVVPPVLTSVGHENPVKSTSLQKKTSHYGLAHLEMIAPVFCVGLHSAETHCVHLGLFFYTCGCFFP